MPVTVLRGYKCSQCGLEVWDPYPHGWRRVRLESTPIRRPGIEHENHAEVCSDQCESDWWTAQLDELKIVTLEEKVSE